MPYTIAQLTTKLRTLTHDAPDDKVIFSEQLGGADMLAYPVDGANTTFRLKNIPMADIAQAGSADAVYTWVTIIGAGAVVRSQVHTFFKVIDPANGIIQFVSAPNPGSATANAGVYVDY